MRPGGQHGRGRDRPLWRRLLWFGALWLAGLAVTGTVAALLRLWIG